MMDWNILSCGATVGATLLAVGSLAALKIQLRQGHENLSASILREHERQFFYSEDFKRIRADTCRFLREQLSVCSQDELPHKWVEHLAISRSQSGVELPQEGWEIIDFLDSLGVYGGRGTVNIEMSFAKFFYFYSRYWFLLKPWISSYRKRDGDVDYYRDIEIFFDDMTRYGRKRRGLRTADPMFTIEEIEEFLDEEITGVPG